MDLGALSPADQTQLLSHHNPFSRSSVPSSFHPSTNQPSFPIIAIAIIGILATAFLLVSYYVFVIKCCLNWHRVDFLRRFSLSSRQNPDSSNNFLNSDENDANNNNQRGGLDAAAIRSIPILSYNFEKISSLECAVCLGEYREGDKLRVIPNCLHNFHIDCIDVWLQSAANCPLCRSPVTIPPNPLLLLPPIQQIGGRSSMEEEFVVAVEVSGSVASTSSSAGDRAVLLGGGNNKKGRRKMSMGDESIVMGRDKDERFVVEPIRRSFSMDSSGDRNMFLAIQEAVRHQSSSGGGGGSRSVRRSFFSFGISNNNSNSNSNNGNYGIMSRGSSRSSSAVLPVYLEP